MADTKLAGTPEQQSMEEKILAAAEKLFLKHGFPLTTTVEIAKEAGCKQALVHYYFRTKEKLFFAVLGGKVKKIFTDFIRLETGEGSFEEKLTRLVEIHFDVVREHSEMVLFFVNEFNRNPESLTLLLAEVGDAPRQMWETLSRDLQNEIEAGRIRPVSLPQLVLNIISLNAFFYLVRPVYARIWNYDKEAIGEFTDNRKKEVVETILKSLKP